VEGICYYTYLQKRVIKLIVVLSNITLNILTNIRFSRLSLYIHEIICNKSSTDQTLYTHTMQKYIYLTSNKQREVPYNSLI
jgi:hypothetical protein